MNKHIFRVSFLAALSLPMVYAQTDAARIGGTVTDATGAVIPAASITVKNEKTGQSRKVQTNDQGHFLVTPLLPSTYSLTAEAPGMANGEYKGIAVQVGQERMLEVKL